MLAIFFTYMLKVPPSGRVERRDETWFTSLTTGFKFAARSQPILGILILLAFQSSFGMPYLSVFVPLIAMQIMDFGFFSALGIIAPERQREIGLGLMMTVSGVGGLVGTLFIATYGDRLRRKGRWVLVGLTGYGTAISLLGLSALLPTVAVAFGVVAFVGLGQAVVMSMKNAILIEQSPNEMLGRVTSLQGLDRGFSTLGGMFSGFAAAAVGAPVAMAIFGGLVIAGTMVVGSLLPGMRRVD
jgi:MFS family permease